MSEIRSFKTAPPVGSNVSYKFIVYGDMGMSAAAHATAKYALRDVVDNGYEFIYHHGDISYARGYVRIGNFSITACLFKLGFCAPMINQTLLKPIFHLVVNVVANISK